MAALRRLSPSEEAELQMREMDAVAFEDREEKSKQSGGSLLRRKYIIPFVLACTILACNQATGINSILGFLVVILKQAGMNPQHATLGDVVVKVLNCLMTIVAIALVDKKGRKFLLKIGTGGVVVSLLACAILFHVFESRRADVRAEVQRSLHDNKLTLALREAAFGQPATGRPMSLTVLYSYGFGDKVATAVSSENDAVLNIVPDAREAASRLVIKRALYGPVPTEETGWLITICLGLFISFFSIGPGVVVWLTLSELMPTRIRSTGMGLALLLNSGVSTLIAALFLPVVGNYGFYAMFLFWAACTLVYFVTATFFLPETKGKTLEEIEEYFENRSGPALTQMS
jgi:MFS family permease